ncbi:hypothetical protein ACFP81_12405 [Deinococcus lacus]|uniref:Oxidoreductase molybdopterin-binding domain-containing protein n=1 Tax=Deinococcus lacus TaxID=392561 RepID=A0ABW1YEB3_9DEIO
MPPLLFATFILFAALGSATAQSSVQWTRHETVRPSLLLVTPQSLRHPAHAYREALVRADPLFGRDLTVQGVTLESVLQRQFGNLAALAEAGTLLGITDRQGHTVRIPLAQVLGQGGLLAYAVAGQSGWPPAGQPGGRTAALYLVWPSGEPASTLRIWDVTRLSLTAPHRPARPAPTSRPARP